MSAKNPGDFETGLQKYGKELDEQFIRMFGDPEFTISYEASPFTVINEINVVLNKSKLLFNPNQFAYMILKNNVYIENPKPGDWLRLNMNNVEEGLINLKDKNKRSKDDTVTHLTTITEKINR